MRYISAADNWPRQTYLHRQLQHQREDAHTKEAKNHEAGQNPAEEITFSQG